jgi:Sigma-70, region 4
VATFDQLPAEQRAIIELVVARGRSYDALADVLQVSAERVRDLARDALVELAPVTGERVDPQWRGQVADYLLGQQSNAEATATLAHLQRSEPARAWALSLIDALDNLYANGDRPAIPEAGGATVAEERERPRERKRDRERAARERSAAATAAPEKAADRAGERERKEKPAGGRAALSPAAQSALRRRRTLGIAGGIAVLAALVVGILALAGVFGGDDDGGGESAAAGTETTAPGEQGQPEIQGQIPLQAVDGAEAQGVAYILQQGDERVLAVTANLPPLPATQRKAAYNVWLYNSPKNAESIGAQFTTPEGDYQGVGPLPENFEDFRFIDVSRQPFNNETGHSGDSVLRGQIADLQPVPEGQQAPPAAEGGGQGGG